MSKSSIIVPVRGRSDFIEVFYDELPEDPSDVIEMLRAELAPLEIWSQFAVAYLSKYQERQFSNILLSVVDAFDVYEMQDFYRKDKNEFTAGRLRILYLLFSSSTSAFVNDLDKETREAPRQKAQDFIRRADEINHEWPPTMLCKAYFWIGDCYQVQIALNNAARYADDLSKKFHHHSLASSLATATILFHQTKYVHSLRVFAHLIQVMPQRISTHLGLGLGALAIGDVVLARLALKRTLMINPKNAVALVATAQTQQLYQNEEKVSDQNTTQMIKRATELKPSYSSALSLLAHRHFWQWHQAPFTVQGKENFLKCMDDPWICLNIGFDVRLAHDGEDAFQARIIGIYKIKNFWMIKISMALSEHLLNDAELHLYWRNTMLIEEIASKAYYCTNIPACQAEAYFILGRNRHAYGDMTGALPYYAHACLLRPEFSVAQFRLAQVHAALGNTNAAIEAARTANKLAPDALEITLLLGVLYLTINNIQESSKNISSTLNALKLNGKMECFQRYQYFAHLTLAKLSEISARKSGKRSILIDTISKYESTSQLLENNSIHVPIELWNNLGVLYFDLGMVTKAALLFIKVIHLLLQDVRGSESNIQYYHHSPNLLAFKRRSLITVILNMLELLISLGYRALSWKTIQFIHQLLPNNIRCSLLLLSLQLSMENEVDAGHRLSELMDKGTCRALEDAKGININSILDKLMHVDDIKLKQNLICSALALKMNSHDHPSEAYIINKIMCAHLILIAPRGHTQDTMRNISKAHRAMYRRLIGDQITASLRELPTSISMGSIVGVLLAYFGYFNDANRMFRLVRNCIGNLSVIDRANIYPKWSIQRGCLSSLNFSLSLSTAHILLLSGDLQEAISSYSTCINTPQTAYSNMLFHDFIGRANLAFLLSYCFLATNKKSRAIRAIASAVKMSPADPLIRFSLMSTLSIMKQDAIDVSGQASADMLVDDHVHWFLSRASIANTIDDLKYKQFCMLMNTKRSVA